MCFGVNLTFNLQNCALIIFYYIVIPWEDHWNPEPFKLRIMRKHFVDSYVDYWAESLNKSNINKKGKPGKVKC